MSTAPTLLSLLEKIEKRRMAKKSKLSSNSANSHLGLDGESLANLPDSSRVPRPQSHCPVFAGNRYFVSFETLLHCY
jgi:hypothetical protein